MLWLGRKRRRTRIVNYSRFIYSRKWKIRRRGRIKVYEIWWRSI
jgi:hypothetical protein